MKKLLGILLSLFFLFPNYIWAHSTGKSYEQEVNGFVIDMGIDQETVVALTPFVFDFTLFEKTDSKEVEYDSIWLSIKDEKETIFASAINRARLGKTTLLYTFPKSGKYDVSLRFMKDDFAHSQTSFEIDVISETKTNEGLVQKNIAIIVGAFIGLLVGSLITIWLKKSTK